MAERAMIDALLNQDKDYEYSMLWPWKTRPGMDPDQLSTDYMQGDMRPAVPGIIADFYNSMVKSGQMIQGERPIDPDEITKIAAEFLPGALAAGRMAPKGATLGMFAGSGAKTADLDKMKIAQRMLDDGVDRADVWKQTGWMRGPDGKMRFEVDDSAARLDMDVVPPAEGRLDLAGGYLEAKYGIPRNKLATGQNPELDKEALAWADKNMHLAREGETAMSAALSHGDAFLAYPDLAKIRLGRETGKAKGSIDATADKIKVGGGIIGRGADAEKSTALHELQHAIQQKEGFAGGGNLSSAYMDHNLRKQWGKEINTLLQPHSRKEYLKLIKAGWPEATPKQLNKSYQEYLKDAKKSLRDPYHPAAKAAQETVAERMYKRLAGEAEARNVQTRMDMTPEQRLAEPPWTTLDVPEADQIVRFERGGTQMALPMDEASRMAKREKVAALRAEANANRDDWAGIHRPPMKDSGAPAHDLTGGGTVYPDDVYSSNAVQYYGTGNKAMDRETVQILNKLKNNPDKMVSIYRAVPPGAKGSEISAGDWVTVNRNYAKDHGESALRGDYVIIERRVPARDIYTNGDSIHEFGFDPSRESMIDALR